MYIFLSLLLFCIWKRSRNGAQFLGMKAADAQRRRDRTSPLGVRRFAAQISGLIFGPSRYIRARVARVALCGCVVEASKPQTCRA